MELSKHLKSSLLVLMPVLWLALIVLVMNITSPMIVGPLGILVVFLLVYLFIASTTYVLARVIMAIFRILRWRVVISNKRALLVSGVIALWPVFLVALNTLGRIGVVEIALVSLLVGLACFYVFRRSETDL